MHQTDEMKFGDVVERVFKFQTLHVAVVFSTRFLKTIILESKDVAASFYFSPQLTASDMRYTPIVYV